MSAQPKDNTGRFSKNDRKEKPNHPDIKGSAMIDGVEYWISGWKKENEKGLWYSLAFDRKEQQGERRVVQREPRRVRVVGRDFV